MWESSGAADAVWRRGLLGAAMLAALILAILMPGRADAHYADSWHTFDLGLVDDSHQYVTAMDGECDGHYVNVRYRLSNGALGVVRDGNGCWGLGTERYVGPLTVVRFQVCEEGVGCAGIRGA